MGEVTWCAVSPGRVGAQDNGISLETFRVTRPASPRTRNSVSVPQILGAERCRLGCTLLFRTTTKGASASHFRSLPASHLLLPASGSASGGSAGAVLGAVGHQ